MAYPARTSGVFPPALASLGKVLPTVAGLFLWISVLLLDEPLARTETGHTDWMARAAEYLREHPHETPVELELAEPLFECLGREEGALRLLYRQDLEMARGTLVARYRATVEFGPEGEIRHERWLGGRPDSWQAIDRNDARRAWRATEPALEPAPETAAR